MSQPSIDSTLSAESGPPLVGFDLARELPHAHRAVRVRWLELQQHTAPPFEGLVVGILLDIQHMTAEPGQRDPAHVDLHPLLLGQRRQWRSARSAGDELFGHVVHPAPELGQRVAYVGNGGGLLGHCARGAAQGQDQDCELTSRMSPSCAVLATSTPAREYRLPRAKPRAPELDGLSRL